jgi:hypothetical protein
MRKSILAAWFIAVLSSLTANAAFAQTCKKPCPSHQCAEQCYNGACDWYCVRDIGPLPAEASKPPGKFTLTIPNATPQLAEKIRRAIEEQ